VVLEEHLKMVEDLSKDVGATAAMSKTKAEAQMNTQ
jgi:hypothetical protein